MVGLERTGVRLPEWQQQLGPQCKLPSCPARTFMPLRSGRLFPGQCFNDIYYFFDNLVLADSKSFEFQITSDQHPCSPDFRLNLPAYDSLDYQWYKTVWPSLARPERSSPHMYGDGSYQARITSPDECRVTQAYAYLKPHFVAVDRKQICIGEQYQFKDRLLSASGDYRDTFIPGKVATPS